MHIIRRPRARDERGAAAVEFALVVVPLLLIIAGIVNFGVVFAQQLALDNSVRAGARAGAVDTGNDPVTVTTNQFTDTALARSTTGTLSVTKKVGSATTCKGSAFGANMQVTGTVTSTFLIPWPAPSSIIPNSVNLTSKAEFQCEYK